MQPKIARRLLGILAALLVLGLVVLWLWPLPPSGVDVSVLPPGDPAQAEAQKARLAAKRLAEQQEEEQPPEEEVITEPDEQEQDAPAFSMQM